MRYPMLVLVLAGVLLCVLLVVVVAMAVSGGQSTTAPTAPLPPGGWVRQTDALPYKCSWGGSWFPCELDMANASQGKWLDVGGLDAHDATRWPSSSSKTFWNPYATTGQYFDGGVRMPVGELPTVNPPKERYGFPYNMEPLWQQGSTDTNEYYKKHCKVTTRGTLYYTGPNRAAGGSGGSYVWYLRPTVTGKATEFVPQPPKSWAKDKMNDADQTVEWIKSGHELPPWERRGILSMDAVIRQHCK